MRKNHFDFANKKLYPALYVLKLFSSKGHKNPLNFLFSLRTFFVCVCMLRNKKKVASFIPLQFFLLTLRFRFNFSLECVGEFRVLVNF